MSSYNRDKDLKVVLKLMITNECSSYRLFLFVKLLPIWIFKIVWIQVCVLSVPKTVQSSTSERQPGNYV